MAEIEKCTLCDRFFARIGFVYFRGEDGQPDYGWIRNGQGVFKIVDVATFYLDGKRIESLELENGQYLPGREIEISR